MRDVVRPRSLVLMLSAALALTALAASARRVLQLERGELEHQSPFRTLAQLRSAPGSTHVSARLTTLTLHEGEHALFELCATDRLEPARWLDALTLAVFRLPEMQLMLRTPLDRAHLAIAKRNARGACLALGAGVIERSGSYSVDAIWPVRPPPSAVQQVGLCARVLARTPLTAFDRGCVIAIVVALMLALLSLLWPRGTAADPPDSEPVSRERRPSQWLLSALGLGAVFALMQVPTQGASLTLLKGVGLVLMQAGAAVLLARGLGSMSVTTALALRPPRRTEAFFGAALVASCVLFASARLSLRLVPATGEAPIQSFVSWPSGMLCFAALGAVLPIGEELFFRGYLYRVALGFGKVTAFFVPLLAFIVLHAQQSWGNWGGLFAITVTGVLLTALRARSGSLLIPAIAHVLYNFALSMASF
jgi:membrane protease YdiL (CAAX protease family)